MARTFSLNLLRVLFVGAALAMALSAAFVFEAARASARTFEAVQAALQRPTPEQRAADLIQAAAIVETSWAQPDRWHAGAAEAISWAYALMAQDDESGVFAARSINAGQRSLWRAPVQAAAWTRLALFAHDGRPNALCDAAACLERSWIAAPLAPLATACARLQLGHELGIVGGADDPRVALMARVPVRRRALQECASFLSSEDMFRLMLLQEQGYDERARKAHETGRSPLTRPYT